MSVEGSGGSGKTGGGVSSSAEEEPNTLRSVAYARVVEGISEGPIAGLVNGEQSIYLDDLPLVEADGTYNFSGFVWEFRAGYPRQSYLSGFPAAETEASVATQVLQATPVIRTISDTNTTSARVRLRFPALHQVNPDTGDLQGTSVEFKIEVRVNGSGTWNTKIHRTLTGKCVAPYERAYRIVLEEGTGPWDIRVTRVTADSGAATLSNDLYWQATVALKDHKIEYSDTAVLGLEVSSEAFGGGVPRRGYEIYGRIVRVPSNYNPVTRAYSGVWDGNFQLAYTNNPAWCLYDLITHTRYGAGIPQANVDKWSFYAVGTYCDGVVSDGDGGTEPRYTFNGILQQAGDPYEIISAFAASFRAAVYHSSGLIYLTQDSPRDADLLVTPANAVNGMFEYQSDDDRVRHNRALVTWNDPSACYEARIEPVEDNGDIAVRGVREKNVVAFGCTSRGQAQRFGAWIIELEKAGTEVVSYTAGPDHGMVLPGWVVAIADPMQYDNDRCLVAQILPDGTRKRARLFSGMLSHYVIQDSYGRPGKGNDKGSVEGLVGYARRNFMVPMPRFATWEAFNAWLEEQCRQRQSAILRGHTETIGQRLQRDLAAMTDLPPAPFEACDQATGRVNSVSLVRYKTNDYSVPVTYGHREVWIRGYVDQVVIGCSGEIIARHPRCYGREDMIFDPVHYLPLIEKKINALDQAAPLANWELPPEFQTLRRLMEARMLKAGRREYVQVLRLMETFDLDEVHEAIKTALRMGAIGFDAIKHLVLCRVEKRPPRLDLDVYPYLPRAHVTQTSAASYLCLMTGGAA